MEKKKNEWESKWIAKNVMQNKIQEQMTIFNIFSMNLKEYLFIDSLNFSFIFDFGGIGPP